MDNVLYYYTTAETMRYILTQGDIFATHINYLNDSEEYVNGLRELRELCLDEKLYGIKEGAIKDDAYIQVMKSTPEIFSISFSKEADLLSQWFMYARESGVRLGMLFPQKDQKFQIKQKVKNGEMRTVESSLKDVCYFTRMGMTSQKYKEEKAVIIKMIDSYVKEKGIENQIDENWTIIWKDIAPYIKNYEFRQEQEVRLIFNASIEKRDGLGPDLIEYRNANGVLAPYLDVYRKDGWPVVEIMVGPGRNQERVFNSICHFVENNSLKIPAINQKESMRRFVEGLSSYRVEQGQIESYCKKFEQDISKRETIITYRDQIYDILGRGTTHEKEYLDRNFYSNCGIIVRKSNAPYVFS